MEMHPGKPHSAGLNALKFALENRNEKQILISDLFKMAEFVVSNNYFEFFDKVYQQNWGMLLVRNSVPSSPRLRLYLHGPRRNRVS